MILVTIYGINCIIRLLHNNFVKVLFLELSKRTWINHKVYLDKKKCAIVLLIFVV